jgi:chromosome segregation ATPase
MFFLKLGNIIKQFVSQRSTLNAKVNQMSTSITEILSEVANIDKGVTALLNKTTTDSVTIATLQETNAALTAHNTVLDQQVSDLTAKQVADEAEDAAASANLETLKASLDTITAKLPVEPTPVEPTPVEPPPVSNAVFQ